MAGRDSHSGIDTPALVSAAADGNLNLVVTLVQQGHSVEARDKSGATALYWACGRGHRLVSQFLLDVGSDTSAKSKSGATALLAAADNGQEDCVKLLLQRKADVNASNNRRDTPLHLAAYRGHAQVLTLLLAAGADPYLKNSASMTALQEAWAQRQAVCVTLLQRHMNTPGHSSSMHLSSPDSVPSLGVDESCKSWPYCLPQSTFSKAVPRRYSLTDPSTGTTFQAPTSWSKNSSNGSNLDIKPGWSTPIYRPDRNHVVNSQLVQGPPSFTENECFEDSLRSINLESWSSPHFTRCTDKSNVSFDSLASQALSVQSLSGRSKIPSSNHKNPSQSTLSAGEITHSSALIAADRTLYTSAHDNKEALRSNTIKSGFHKHPIANKAENNSPKHPLLQNEHNLANRNVDENCDELSKTFKVCPPPPLPKRLSRADKSRSLKEVMPGVNVADFMEQVQIQMIELQKTLSLSQSENVLLKEQLALARRQNSELNSENQTLRCLISDQVFAQLPSKNLTESALDRGPTGHLADLSEPLSLCYISENGGGPTRGRKAVESSECVD